METIIKSGAVLDTPSTAEMRDHIGGAVRDAERQRELQLARGIKWMRRAVPSPGTASTQKIEGPEAGHAWKLRRLSVVLTAADSLTVYIGDSAVNSRIIAYAPSVTGQTIYVVTFGPEEILQDSEGLYLATTGTGSFLSHYVSAWQVMTEQIWKFL